MKTDRHSPTRFASGVKHGPSAGFAAMTCWLPFLLLGFVSSAYGQGDDTSTVAIEAESPVAQTAPEVSQPKAKQLLQRVLQQIALGPAFDAKVRETVWATGRQVVGVGTYEQAGRGTGQFNLQITMHDGDGKHRLQQISDGRLAWTRSEISGNVSLRRVDVGRLDEWVRQSAQATPIAPRLKIGGWTEMLDQVDRDFVIRADGYTLKEQRVFLITGTLRSDVRAKTLADSGRERWPVLCPTKVRIAVAATSDPVTGFGALLPVRIEFWSDPIATPSSDGPVRPEGRLITLIELYSIRPISAPPIERFRFDNNDAEVNFVNETERYIQQFGVQLSASQKRLLRR